MNLKIFYFYTALVTSLSLSAESTFYGKLLLTAEHEKNNITSESDLVSRELGLKVIWM